MQAQETGLPRVSISAGPKGFGEMAKAWHAISAVLESQKKKEKSQTEREQRNQERMGPSHCGKEAREKQKYLNSIFRSFVLMFAKWNLLLPSVFQ